MNPKLEDILRDTDLDKIVKWEKPSEKLIDTIEAEKAQAPDWSTDDSDDENDVSKPG